MASTHERELTEPVDLCEEDGQTLNGDATGWSRRPLHRANLVGRRFRTKKWDYWAVLADDLAIGLVYADVGYLGLVSVWWGDLASGATGGRDAATPFGRGLSLPDRPGAVPLVFRSDRLSMDLTDSDRGTRLSAAWTAVDGSNAELDVFVDRPPDHESLSVVIPWSDRTFQFTTKDQARPVHGHLRRADRVTTIGGDRDAWGVLDVGRGRWPYSVTWNWAGGAGRAESGELVGIQLGGRWTQGTGHTENAITIDGRLHKIGRELIWRYNWDHPMRPWRVVDPGGDLDLTLTPRLDKHSGANALVLRTEVHQVFGTWSGTVRTADGTPRRIEGAPGFAEESRNHW